MHACFLLGLLNLDLHTWVICNINYFLLLFNTSYSKSYLLYYIGNWSQSVIFFKKIKVPNCMCMHGSETEWRHTENHHCTPWQLIGISFSFFSNYFSCGCINRTLYIIRNIEGDDQHSSFKTLPITFRGSLQTNQQSCRSSVLTDILAYQCDK